MATPSSYQRVGATASDYDASAGPTYLQFDGVDDSLSSATFAAGTISGLVDCLIAVRRDSADALMLGSYIGAFFGVAASGDGNTATSASLVGTPTYYVNNVAVPGGTGTTRGQLHTAMPVGEWLIVEVRNLDLSTWNSFVLCSWASGGGYNLNGALGGIQLFASGQDANRDKARAQMAAYFGVTLP